MTIEEIQQQCEALSNEQLLLVVNNKRLYNEKIVRAAYQEIRKRGLSKQEVICLPRIHYWVLRDYRRQGFVLNSGKVSIILYLDWYFI